MLCLSRVQKHPQLSGNWEEKTCHHPTTARPCWECTARGSHFARGYRGGMTMAGREGQQLGNYRLVALLGQGSSAAVYLGQHVRLPLQAAVKVLHAHLTGSEAEHFQHEAKTIARLTHPSIVRIFDYDVQEGVPFLA